MSFDVFGLDAGGVHDVFAPQRLSALLKVFALQPQRLQLVHGDPLALGDAELAESQRRVVCQSVVWGQGAVVTEHAGRHRLLNNRQWV